VTYRQSCLKLPFVSHPAGLF